MFKVKFWGTRGSIPTPLLKEEVFEKEKSLLYHFYNYQDTLKMESESSEEYIKRFIDTQSFHTIYTYGGNTTCVEVVCGKHRIIIDAGTGIRLLGNSLMEEIVSKKGIHLSMFITHKHWDHIQGLPFFKPIYMNRRYFKNSFTFYGGSDWQKSLEICLQGQMDPPLFPVSFAEIKHLVEDLHFESIHDLFSFVLSDGDNDEIYIECRKLDHPNETYGYRIKYKDKIFAFTTDNEPRDPENPDPKLLYLARDADLWATDCQYTRDTYNEIGGACRHGWGHSYPEAVSQTAYKAKVKKLVLTHHDPESNDHQIYMISCWCQSLLNNLSRESRSNIDAVAAYDGLEIDLLKEGKVD